MEACNIKIRYNKSHLKLDLQIIQIKTEFNIKIKFIDSNIKNFNWLNYKLNNFKIVLFTPVDYWQNDKNPGVGFKSTDDNLTLQKVARLFSYAEV